jgi:hypothetical protein
MAATHATKPIPRFLAATSTVGPRERCLRARRRSAIRAALPALQKLAKETSDENFRGLTQAAIKRIQQKPAPEVVPPALARDRRPHAPDDTGEDDGTP